MRSRAPSKPCLLATLLLRFQCELSVLERQCLARRLPDVETLKREVAAWEHRRNQAPVTIDWRFTAADARIKLKRLYPVLKEQKEQKAA
jgi:hypothetical protein